MNFRLVSVTPRGAFAFAHEVETIPLDGQGLVNLYGPNGSGKSSIMNAVTTALFGKNDLGYEGDDVINRVLDDGCNIQVVFEAGGTTYLVEYCRKYRKSGKARETDIFFYSYGADGESEDLRGESQSDTLARIRQTVGMDYSQFVATSYLGTQTAPRFLNGTDSTRMEVITPFLGLSIWDRVQIRIREALGSKRDSLTHMSASLAAVLHDAEELSARVLSDEEVAAVQESIASSKGRKARLQAERDQVLLQSTDLQSRIADLDAEARRLEFDLAAATTRLRNFDTSSAAYIAETSKATFDGWDAQLRETETRYQVALAKAKSDVFHAQNALFAAVATEFDEALAAASVAYGAAKSVLEQHRGFDAAEGTCPHCGSEVTAEWVGSLEHANQERVAELQAAVDVALAEHVRVSDQVAAATEAEKVKRKSAHAAASDEHKRLALEYKGIIDVTAASARRELQAWQAERTERERSKLNTERGPYVFDIDDKKAELDRTTAQIVELRRDPEAQAVQSRIQALRQEIVTLDKLMEDGAIRLLTSEQNSTGALVKTKLAESLHAQVEVQRSEIEDLEFLEKHVGDKGFKRFKLRSCIGFMNERLAHHMEVLGLPLQVWLQDRELKKSALRKKPEDLRDEDWADRFEMFVKDGVKERVPVGMYSGGERTLISLSLLGTLWETANLYGGGGSNVLMLDEPFGLLASDNRDRAVALIEFWRTLGKTILVSDNTGACDAVRPDLTIAITKKDHVSTYRLLR